jgi:hypothetical protein
VAKNSNDNSKNQFQSFNSQPITHNPQLTTFRKKCTKVLLTSTNLNNSFTPINNIKNNIMKTIFKTLAFLFIAILASCSKDGSGSNNASGNTDDPNFVLVDPTEITGIGEVTDYSLVVPPEWKADLQQDRILLLDKNKLFNGPIIDIFKPIQGSGNLETDMNNLFLNSYLTEYYDYGSQSLRYDEKGKTMQGFDYYLIRRQVKNKNTQEQRTVALLLIQLKSSIAVIVYQSPDFSNVVQELSYLLFSLRFNKESIGNITLSKDILGPWSLVTLYAAAYETFYGDGNFTKGGATSFTVSLNATYDQITTTTFSSSGNYKLTRNQYKQYFKSNNTTYTHRTRVYSSKLNQDNWKLHKANISFDEGWNYQQPVEWDSEK